MYDNQTVQVEDVVGVMKNLLDQAKKLEVMVKLSMLSHVGENDEPPAALALLEGIGKGTEATIYSTFFRLFHQSKNRSELMQAVGLDEKVYMETADRIDELAKNGGPMPNASGLFADIMKDTKH